MYNKYLEKMMEAVTYSYARQNLAKTMNRVCNEHDLVIITRKASKPVVMISLEDYNSTQETAYLLQSPANAARLRESIKQHEAGDSQTRDPIE